MGSKLNGKLVNCLAEPWQSRVFPDNYFQVIFLLAKTIRLLVSPGMRQKAKNVRTEMVSILQWIENSTVFPKMISAEDIEPNTVRLSLETFGKFELIRQAQIVCVEIADKAP